MNPSISMTNTTSSFSGQFAHTPARTATAASTARLQCDAARVIQLPTPRSSQIPRSVYATPPLLSKIRAVKFLASPLADRDCIDLSVPSSVLPASFPKGKTDESLFDPPLREVTIQWALTEYVQSDQGPLRFIQLRRDVLITIGREDGPVLTPRLFLAELLLGLHTPVWVPCDAPTAETRGISCDLSALRKPLDLFLHCTIFEGLELDPKTQVITLRTKPGRSASDHPLSSK